MNRLTLDLVRDLASAIESLSQSRQPLIIAGNQEYFSVGANLNEISRLNGAGALEFGRTGQMLMSSLAAFPAPCCAAISGHCFGGGLDLALACHGRIASSNAFFGHRGAALGLITGWGGTQRLPRLVGKGRAMQMLIAADTIPATEALRIGLVDAIADDPVAEAIRRITATGPASGPFAPSDPAGIP